MSVDCKNLFNLPPNYSEKQLRKIYLALAMQHHPDKSQGSTEEMVRINLCYEELLQNATKGSGKQSRRTGNFSTFSEYVASLKKWKLVQVVQDRHCVESDQFGSFDLNKEEILWAANKP